MTLTATVFLSCRHFYQREEISVGRGNGSVISLLEQNIPGIYVKRKQSTCIKVHVEYGNFIYILNQGLLDTLY
jgi:hypothetical protein